MAELPLFLTMSQLELHRIMAKNIPDVAIFLFDKDMNILMAEGEALRFYSADKDELDGSNLSDVVGENSDLLAQYKTAFLGQRIEKEYVFESGSYLVVSLPVYDDNNDIVAGMAIARYLEHFLQISELLAKTVLDLTILRQIDEELNSLLSLEYVVDIALDALMRISNASAAVIALFNGDKLEPKQWVGECDEWLMKKMMRRGEPLYHLTVQREQKMMTGFPNPLYPEPFSAKANSVIVLPLITLNRVLGVAVLETSRLSGFNHHQEELSGLLATRIAVGIDNAEMYLKSQVQLIETQQLYERVRELEQLKTDMIRTASHGVNNPLAGLFGYLNLLEWDAEAPLSATQKEYIQHVREAARRIERIAKGMLSLEHAHAVSTNKVEEVVSLAGLTKSSLLSVQSQITLKHIKITHHTTERTDIKCDPFQLQEAITNLLDNAVKYTPTNGEVRIMIEPAADGRQITLKISDNGFGVPETQKPRLFEPFFRAKMNETATIEGTGLGLYIVKHIIEQHNGNMIFESTYGKGSTFGFTLPLHRAD